LHGSRAAGRILQAQLIRMQPTGKCTQQRSAVSEYTFHHTPWSQLQQT
jgi:hypothetical protein